MNRKPWDEQLPPNMGHENHVQGQQDRTNHQR